MKKIIKPLDYGNDKDDYEVRLEQQIYCDNPNEAEIRKCVENGANISGRFLFDIICMDMKNKSVTIDAVKLLIELGADVYWHEPDGHSCLTYAIQNDMPDLAELLFNSGISQK